MVTCMTCVSITNKDPRPGQPVNGDCSLHTCTAPFLTPPIPSDPRPGPLHGPTAGEHDGRRLKIHGQTKAESSINTNSYLTNPLTPQSSEWKKGPRRMAS